ncbi:Increased recombination centers protein 22-2 [Leucoagaricus sp. SymC.cos]|nr:Increased recombination centers protein 22-2 [Leucoagaricus sp. SymC.cos]
MRLNHIFSAALSVAALVSSVVADEAIVEEVSSSTEPEIVVTASFPDTNPFNQIINGEKNALTLSIENKSDRNVTLLGVSGSLHHPETDALIKNLTSLNYGFPLLEGAKINIPYVFYSEFKTGDARLNLWLEHLHEDQKYVVSAYDSIVTIVEPEISWLDWKMWSTYLVVAGFFGGLSYFAYLTFAPQPKKRTKKSTPAVSAPAGTVTATGAGGYQEEWIPEHHLRKGKKTKQTSATSGTSADELSGAEISGAEGKKRKGRK